MGESRKNLATEGLSGLVGNFVFRRRKDDGKIFVSRKPGSFDGTVTAAQKVIQDKFVQATIYAKAAIAVPAIKAAYKEVATRGKSAYNMAVADYFNAPVIDELLVEAYTGLPGSKITIKATDDFEVKSVQVHIAHSDGTLIEEGSAVVQDDDLHWIYTATASNASLAGTKVTVTATDNPNNKTVQQKVLV